MTEPTIAESFVLLAKRMADRLGDPRVRALHLTAQCRQADNEVDFCAIELDDGSVGWSYISLGDTDRQMRATIRPEDFAGRAAVSLAEDYAGGDPVARAIGFAAINALSQRLFARAGWAPDESDDSLGSLAPQAGDHIGMIGLFARLVPQVLAAGAKLTVLELNPELAREGEYLVTLDPASLASCQKVVSTCTVLLNDTFDSVLATCRSAGYLAIIGPTAGCLPDPLFARGVASVGGRRVADLEGFIAALRSGDKWGSFTRKYTITQKNYPGIDWLLNRAAGKWRPRAASVCICVPLTAPVADESR